MSMEDQGAMVEEMHAVAADTGLEEDEVRDKGTWERSAEEEIDDGCCRYFPADASREKSLVDGETLRRSLTQTASVTKVLDDDNLLREIIVRVGFPTTLVRAALVCRRWIGHASDPAFLRRFRKLHPHRLLGYYISEGSVFSGRLGPPCFVPMLPQPPELAAVIRRVARYRFGPHEIMHCQNGIVFARLLEGWEFTPEVHHPLCLDKGMPIFPPFPRVQDRNLQRFNSILSKEEEGRTTYLYVLGEYTKEGGKSMTRVYMLQDGVWRMHTSVTCQLRHLLLDPQAVFGNKLYILTTFDYIIVLDLMASNFSTVQLPQGVKYDYFKTRLSRAEDASGVYLIHVKELQLCIWLHKGDNWLLVDTICLQEMRAILGMSDHTLENADIADVQISKVGDDGQFVFLRMDQCIFYLDIKCRALCKVYENTVKDRYFGDVYPFMMIWPPTFPASKDSPARNAM